MTKLKHHFKGLNELRAVAALAVICFHLSGHLQSPTRFMRLGNAGVSLFFVLSGFLITYLLLEEKKNTNTISIKNFYIRRTLRIAPLYYFYIALLLIGLFTGIYKESFDLKNLLFYIFFLGNIPFWLGKFSFPMIAHYWSLGVEEQFYIFVPWIIKKSHPIFKTVLVIWAALFCLKIGGRIIEALTGNGLLYAFMNVFSFHTMAVGSIAACILFYNHQSVLRLIFNPLLQALTWLVLLATAFDFINGVVPSVIFHEVFGISVAFIILNTVANPNPIFKIEHKLLDFLGKISFGLYVYHLIVIRYVSSKLMPPIYQLVGNMGDIIHYILVISLTALLAYLSYNFIEKPFLNRKDKFSSLENREK